MSKLVTKTQEVAKATGRVFKAYDIAIIVIFAVAAMFVVLAKQREQMIALAVIAILVVPVLIYKAYCRFSKGKPSEGNYKNGWR